MLIAWVESTNQKCSTLQTPPRSSWNVEKYYPLSRDCSQGRKPTPKLNIDHSSSKRSCWKFLWFKSRLKSYIFSGDDPHTDRGLKGSDNQCNLVVNMSDQFWASSLWFLHLNSAVNVTDTNCARTTKINLDCSFSREKNVFNGNVKSRKESSCWRRETSADGHRR